MGTFYTLSSRFVAKPDVTEHEIRRHVMARSEGDEPYRELPGLLGRGEISLGVSGRKLEVSLEFSGYCAYRTATALDEEWTRLAKFYADFAHGPVRCTSGGEDYDEGAFHWLIGPETAVLRARLRDVRLEIAGLQRRKRDLVRAVKGATRRLVSTNG